MPNSTSDKFDKAALLAAWMDGQLSPEQREQFESLCSTDSEFANHIQIANQATLLANDYQTENVAEWDRSSTFAFDQPNKWWQWQGFPAFSTAMSVLALVLVVSGFEVRIENSAMTFSFQKSTPDIDTLVEQKMAKFRDDQQ